MKKLQLCLFLAITLLSCSKDDDPLAPVASFTFSPKGGCEASCTVTFTSTSLNANTFEWDFDDGSPKVFGNVVEHEFIKSKIYKVKLVASGEGGSDDTNNDVNITEPAAKKPVAKFEIGNDNCEAPCKVLFTNTSQFTTQHKWSFGDQSADSISMEESPVHEFKKSGTFVVSLIANGAGGTDTFKDTVTIKPKTLSPPIADFTYSIDCTAPCKCFVSFVNTTTNDSPATKYSWDFGNKRKSATKTPPKIEYTSGEDVTYEVSLKATNEDGSADSAVSKIKIEKTTVEIDEILVEGGEFDMGTDDGKEDAQPIHKVTVPGFLIDKYEITIEEWRTYKTATKINMTFPGYDYSGCSPMVNISWKEAVQFCNWLSSVKKLTPCYTINGDNVAWNTAANGYRLPTEAEWEYAARGGKKGTGKTFAGSDDPNAVAWHKENSNEASRAVGLKMPNELGLYDMSGNVYEWCWDWLGNDYYAKSTSRNPTGPESGEFRVVRGGSYAAEGEQLTSTFRAYKDPESSTGFIGFRVVRNP